MKIKILLVFLFFFFLAVLFSQSDTLNRIDKSGERDGYWTVFYDANGKEVSDSVRGVYYRFTWYEHGKDIYQFDLCGKQDEIISSSNNEQDVGLKLLDGEYKIVDKKGNIKSIHVFNKGEYISYKNFYPSGQLYVYCDFTNRFYEEPHSYCRRVYSKTGDVKYYYMRDQPNDEDINDENPARFERSYFDSTSLSNKRVVGDSCFVTATNYVGNQIRQQADWFFISEDGGERPILHGVFTTYYANGQKKEERRYDYNTRIGKTKYWYKDGTEMSSEINFDQLNQTDEDGKKTGWWIVYLDDNFKRTKDSVGATHCMYNYFTGKYSHYNWGVGFLGIRKDPVQFPVTDTLKLGNFILLNGDYITNYKSGKVRTVLSAEYGILTEFKEYYKDGQLKTLLIYSAECGSPIRICIKSYDKKGNLTYDGWNMVPQDSRKFD